MVDHTKNKRWSTIPDPGLHIIPVSFRGLVSCTLKKKTQVFFYIVEGSISHTTFVYYMIIQN